MMWTNLFSLFLVSSAFAADRTARIFEIGKTNEAPIYTQKMHTEKLPSGDTAGTVTVYDPQGNVVVIEHSVFNGTKLISQMYEQKQTKKRLELKVDDGWLYFKARPLDSEKISEIKEDHEKMPKDFLTGPISEGFLAEHLSELMAEKTVHCHFGVLELRETIGFKFWMMGKSKVGPREVIDIGMKPSNVFLGFLVPTIHIFFDPTQKKIVKFIGRTPMWKMRDGKLHGLDAEILYD